MSSTERLEQQRQDLDQRWSEVQTLLAGLRRERAVETRFDEQFRLDELVKRKQAELTQIELEQEGVRRQLSAQQLLADARERERKQAFDEALLCWEKIRKLNVAAGLEEDAEEEMARLRSLKATSDKRAALLRQLAPFVRDIAPVFKSVLQFIQQSSLTGQEPPQVFLEQLLAHAIDATTFAQTWPDIYVASARAEPASLDFSALWRRISRGEIALFLGADLPHQFDPQVPSTQRLAQELAQEVQLISKSSAAPASLSAVAEYFQIEPNHGERQLLRGLRNRLPPSVPANPLFALLVRVSAPLLIVHAGPDRYLEAAFREAGKRFVVVQSVIAPLAGFHPGQVLVHYSDRAQPEAPMLSEDLSQHALMERGYSLIFKLRGSLPSDENFAGRDLCSLVLSEHNHFDFARGLDHLLPDYLKTQLGSLGLWFLGFAAERWEDRLLASAVLDGRRSKEPGNLVAAELGRFEAAYWTSRGIQRHVHPLAAFVRQLASASR